MNIQNLFTRNRATLKLLFVGMLSIVMLIPLSMIRAVIAERQEMQQKAEQTIADRWGGGQGIGGLVAVTSTPVARTDNRSYATAEQWTASVLTDLSINVALSTEVRYLGIYEVPVYTA
ncbi:MAG: hypothetical protein HKO88_14920, partial [Xanthomonadales bacterium]|nr:hypothetical protein [Xanthomonadales bacterium]